MSRSRTERNSNWDSKETPQTPIEHRNSPHSIRNEKSDRHYSTITEPQTRSRAFEKDEMIANDNMMVREREDDRKYRGSSFDHGNYCGPPPRTSTSDTPCKFFAVGKCRNGKDCRFSHHDPQAFTTSSDVRSRDYKSDNADHQSRDLKLREVRNRNQDFVSDQRFSPWSKSDRRDHNLEKNQKLDALGNLDKVLDPDANKSTNTKMGNTESRAIDDDTWLNDMETSREWMNYKGKSPIHNDRSLPINNVSSQIDHANMIELKQYPDRNDDSSSNFGYVNGNSSILRKFDLNISTDKISGSKSPYVNNGQSLTLPPLVQSQLALDSDLQNLEPYSEGQIIAKQGITMDTKPQEIPSKLLISEVTEKKKEIIEEIKKVEAHNDNNKKKKENKPVVNKDKDLKGEYMFSNLRLLSL